MRIAPGAAGKRSPGPTCSAARSTSRGSIGTRRPARRGGGSPRFARAGNAQRRSVAPGTRPTSAAKAPPRNRCSRRPRGARGRCHPEGAGGSQGDPGPEIRRHLARGSLRLAIPGGTAAGSGRGRARSARRPSRDPQRALRGPGPGPTGPDSHRDGPPRGGRAVPGRSAGDQPPGRRSSRRGVGPLRPRETPRRGGPARHGASGLGRSEGDSAGDRATRRTGSGDGAHAGGLRGGDKVTMHAEAA